MRKNAIGIVCVIAVLEMSALAQLKAPEKPAGEGAPPAQTAERRGIGGVISEISGDTITLQGRDGRTESVKVTKATKYRRDGQDAKLADFKVGDRVMMGGEQKDGMWKAQIVASGMPGGMGMNREDMGKRFIAGEVTKIEGTKLTVHRIDGEDQVIQVDDSTVFQNAKHESITLADIKVGDKVRGRGELKDGTFVPATLNIGAFPQRFGPGGPMRGGQGAEKPQPPQK